MTGVVRVWAGLLAVGPLLSGCSGDEEVTFARMGKLEANASVNADYCKCPPGTICLICSGARYDGYLLTLQDPGAGKSCLEGDEKFSATWVSESKHTPEVDFRCNELEVLVEVGAGDEIPDGSLTISDGSTDWTIDEPFRRPGFALVGDVPAPPDRLEVAVGQELELSVAGSDVLMDLHASLETEGAPPYQTFDADIMQSGSSLFLTVPEIDTGAYSLRASATPLVPSDACRGPERCVGLRGGFVQPVFLP